MRCKDYKEMIFLYDELGPGERTELESHLHHCSGCAALVAERDRQRSMIAALYEGLVPVNNAALTRRIMDALPHTQPSASGVVPRIVIRYLAGSLAAAAALLFVAEAGLSRSSSPMPQVIPHHGPVLSTSSFLNNRRVSAPRQRSLKQCITTLPCQGDCPETCKDLLSAFTPLESKKFLERL